MPLSTISSSWYFCARVIKISVLFRLYSVQQSNQETKICNLSTRNYFFLRAGLMAKMVLNRKSGMCATHTEVSSFPREFSYARVRKITEERLSPSVLCLGEKHTHVLVFSLHYHPRLSVQQCTCFILSAYLKASVPSRYMCSLLSIPGQRLLDQTGHTTWHNRWDDVTCQQNLQVCMYVCIYTSCTSCGTVHVDTIAS